MVLAYQEVPKCIPKSMDFEIGNRCKNALQKQAFSNIDFSLIFRRFWPRFGRVLARFGDQRWGNLGSNKRLKIELRFLKDLGRVWGRFGQGFGKVLGRSGSLLGALGASQSFFVAVLAHFWVVRIFFQCLGSIFGYFGCLWLLWAVVGCFC